MPFSHFLHEPKEGPYRGLPQVLLLFAAEHQYQIFDPLVLRNITIFNLVVKTQPRAFNEAPDVGQLLLGQVPQKVLNREGFAILKNSICIHTAHVKAPITSVVDE